MTWLIYCTIFSSFSKQPFLGSGEIVEDNRYFNDLKQCMKLADKHTHLRWCDQLIKHKFPQYAPANLETSCLLEIGDFSQKLLWRCSCQFPWCALALRRSCQTRPAAHSMITLAPFYWAISLYAALIWNMAHSDWLGNHRISQISDVQSAGWLDIYFTVGTSCESAAPLAEKNAAARHHVLRSLISLNNEHRM
jgi:hypothetical protein